MSDKLNLAGVIGTWVAASVAIVALIGIVGPILVWKASRTERHQALAAIDAGQAESGGFISKGVRLWPGIRLFRRVRAPVLHAEPLLKNFTTAWEDERAYVSKASASWVKFGLAIRSLHLDHEVGNSLSIRSSQAVLPVHKTWLLTLGLAGRFGKRKDDGKLPKARRTGVISTQAVPGAALDRASYPSSRVSRDSVPGWMTDKPRWADDIYDERQYRYINDTKYEQISGIFGTLYTSVGSYRHSATIHFDMHDKEEIGSLDTDRLPIDQLFWLAVGCIPSANGQVFGLENVQFVATENDENEESVVPSILQIPGPVTPGAVRWDDQDDEYSARPARHAVHFSATITPATYVPAVNVPATIESPNYSYSRSWGVRAFKFSPTHARVESLQEVAKALGVEQQGKTVLSLEEIALTDDERRDLEYLGTVTYPPSEYDWARLTSADKFGTSGSAWYLRRSDGQVLANALLELPICRKGYLFHRSKTSKCREFLCLAATMLPRLLINIIYHFDLLVLDENVRPSLLAAVNRMNLKLQRYEYTRDFMTTICELDEILEGIVPSDKRITNGVGVLILCHEEFRDLITLAVRRMAQSISRTVQIDLENPAIVIKAVLGAEQRFPIDMNILFPDFLPEQQSIEITFTTLITIALKASLRSSFLKTSLNSLPLLERVVEMDDIIYIG
ncbi:hypothetical protein FOMA001_g13595 [Fusarium oxysporum f. sp. matthiolae]|nr:hypothetical protein FOMA001_g13595 [Fusarium oxysporum f. sp. matthiolae]